MAKKKLNWGESIYVCSLATKEQAKSYFSKSTDSGNKEALFYFNKLAWLNFKLSEDATNYIMDFIVPTVATELRQEINEYISLKTQEAYVGGEWIQTHGGFCCDTLEEMFIQLQDRCHEIRAEFRTKLLEHLEPTFQKCEDIFSEEERACDVAYMTRNFGLLHKASAMRLKVQVNDMARGQVDF